jgi:signal transduction histidine kinase
MNIKILSIKSILLFFVALITLTLMLFIVIFVNQNRQLENNRAYLPLQQTVAQFAQGLDREIESATQTVHRLKRYVSILKTGVTENNLTFLQQLMAENLQFETNHYSSYIALEPFKARQYFNQRGKLLLVHKDIELRNTIKYNRPQYTLQKSWNEPSYANDPRTSWYYLSKQSNDIQITPIYFDADYTHRSVFSISQGLHKHRTFEGVVGVSILVDTFFEGIENHKLGNTGGLFLADFKTGLLLSKIGPVGSPLLSFLNAKERNALNLYSKDIKQPFWKNILNKDMPSIEVKNNEGEYYTLSSQKLRLLPWTLVSYQRTDELKQDNSLNRFPFITVAIIILILLAAMVLVFFKTLILPLSELLQMSHKITGQSSRRLQRNQWVVIELRHLAEMVTKMAKKTVKINSERLECLKRLQASRLAKAEKTQQRERCYVELKKIKLETHHFQEKMQKANLHIQKARIELQKHKLESKRAKVQTHAANQAKEQFLANMGVELRTPMNAIMGYTEILQEDAREQGLTDFIPDLQNIHGASYHLLDLINNLFDMSRIESSQMDLYIETFDIAPMIQDVVATISPLLVNHSNLLKVLCDPALGTMSADLTKVRQNLLNLLTNANKFSQQSTISLTVMRETVEGVDWILFRIADQGIGMTQEQIKKLFQAFVQIDTGSRKSGNGLGLAITKKFSQIMGGDIWVESQVGQGSTFTMRLPAQVTPVGE